MKKLTNAGFTIVELLIATAVFSVVLLLVSEGMIQIGRTYMKGVTLDRNQTTTQSIMDDISQAIQFSGGDITTVTPAFNPADMSPPTYYFCVDNNRYTFRLNTQLTDGSPIASSKYSDGSSAPGQAQHVLIKDTVSGCASQGPANLANPDPTTNPRELLGVGMRLRDLTVTQIGASSSYLIRVNVVYGDSDLLTTDLKCGVSSRAGGSFCATLELASAAQKRIQ
jgi:prepilin-type N-terminal cleavage/methylation domain-containing protein